MKKQEFLTEIAGRLTGMIPEDIDRALEFYAEMIDDRMEEGLSEEEAVAAVGSVEEIVSRIRASFPSPGNPGGNPFGEENGKDGNGSGPSQNVPFQGREEKAPRRALRAWEIILLILGSPVWLPLLLAAFIILLSLVIVLWSLVLVVFAVEIGFGAGAISGVASGMAQFFAGNGAQALWLLGSGLVCTGLAILLFFGIGYVCKGAALLCKWGFQSIKRCFTGKERR